MKMRVPLRLHMCVCVCWRGCGAEGTAEQVAEWLFPALEMRIFGCLAQTELGHGSNVRGLMTTATYDASEFGVVLLVLYNGCGKHQLTTYIGCLLSLACSVYYALFRALYGDSAWIVVATMSAGWW